MPRFEKGSEEAKAYMRNLREKRNAVVGGVVDVKPLKGRKPITLNTDADVKTTVLTRKRGRPRGKGVENTEPLPVAEPVYNEPVEGVDFMLARPKPQPKKRKPKNTVEVKAKIPIPKRKPTLTVRKTRGKGVDAGVPDFVEPPFEFSGAGINIPPPRVSKSLYKDAKRMVDLQNQPLKTGIIAN
jgi:hypothetical protein